MQQVYRHYFLTICPGNYVLQLQDQVLYINVITPCNNLINYLKLVCLQI